MSCTINGTCSICGGAITTPTFWWGVIPPTPSCSQCGAVPAQAHGPVIPMRPAPRYRTITGTSVQDMQELIDQINAGQQPRLSTTPADDRYCGHAALWRDAADRHVRLHVTSNAKIWPELAHAIANRGGEA